MDKVPAGGLGHRDVFGDLRRLITRGRKRLADTVVPAISLPADDVTRLRGWVCFAAAIAVLYRKEPITFGLLMLALVLDSADGAVARQQGTDCPQTDRAMDAFTEFMLCGSYLTSYPGWISAALMSLWVVPKTLWVGDYLARRLAPGRGGAASAGQPDRTRSVARRARALLVLLQSFPFVHVLAILVFLQWTLRWDLP